MEIKKIKLDRWYNGGIADCAFMNDNEYEVIRMNRDTPDLVYNTDTGKLLYNSFTCTSSYRYGGTCNCISHSPKIWTDFTNHFEEVLE